MGIIRPTRVAHARTKIGRLGDEAEYLASLVAMGMANRHRWHVRRDFLIAVGIILVLGLLIAGAGNLFSELIAPPGKIGRAVTAQPI